MTRVLGNGRGRALLIVANVVLALTGFAVAALADDTFRNCCKKDTGGERFCCDGCCIGTVDSCAASSECTVEVE